MRRSEWPTITAEAPASLSISAEMSPVKAPEASAWQSCAPIATGELRARVAKPAIRVAGGQTSRSMRVASGPAPSMIFKSSVADCCKPFIFQLPAMSGRSALAMANPYLLPFGKRLAERTGAGQRLRPQGRSVVLRRRHALPMMRRLRFAEATRKPFCSQHGRSMLRGLRQASSGWLGKSIMGLVVTVLVVSFAIWGIGDIFRGFGRSSLAKIGHTEVTIEQFRQLYNERLQNFGRQIGRVITLEQARALGIDRQITQQIFSEILLDERVRELRLGVSDGEIAKRIMQDPSFQGPSGQFDRQRFEQMIRSAGFTEQRFVAEQRRNILRGQLVGTLTGAPITPSAVVEAADR